MWKEIAKPKTTIFEKTALINERAKEAREAYAIEKDVPYNEREFSGNASIERVNDYKVRIGTNQRMEFFWIEPSKQ